MIEIAFLRHGHALTAREAGVAEDARRPLSAAGEREAQEAAVRLQKTGFTPDLIIFSPFLRAELTARIAARIFPDARLETSAALSDGPAQAVLDLINELPPSGPRRVLLVGHQPLLGALAGFLLGLEPFHLSPAGFVRLRPAGAAGGKTAGASLVEVYEPPGTGSPSF